METDLFGLGYSYPRLLPRLKETGKVEEMKALAYAVPNQLTGPDCPGHCFLFELNQQLTKMSYYFE